MAEATDCSGLIDVQHQDRFERNLLALQLYCIMTDSRLIKINDNPVYKLTYVFDFDSNEYQDRDINENLGTCNDGSSGRVARGDSSASDVDISKPGGSRNISAPMLRDITTNPSQVTKRTMSAPAPHRTSSSLRRAPMSRTFSFSPNLKRHFLARSLSNPRTHVRIVRACVVVCCNSWHDVNITCRALLTSQCVCCGIVTAGRPSRRMAYCDSCRRMAWCFCHEERSEEPD